MIVIPFCKRLSCLVEFRETISRILLFVLYTCLRNSSSTYIRCIRAPELFHHTVGLNHTLSLRNKSYDCRFMVKIITVMEIRSTIRRTIFIVVLVFCSEFHTILYT